MSHELVDFLTVLLDVMEEVELSLVTVHEAFLAFDRLKPALV